MNKRAFNLGRAFRAGMDYAMKRRIAQDDWVTLQNKEGEYYRVDLPGENLNSSEKSSSSEKNQSNAERKQLNQDHIDAIEHYVSGNGMWVNRSLRRGEQLSGIDKELVKDLDGALNEKVTHKTLYRSTDAKAIFGNISEAEYDDLRNALSYGVSNRYEDSALKKAKLSVGKSITEKGYMSTTRDADVAENFKDFTGSTMPVVMKITTSRNTRGRDVHDLTENIRKAESESPQKETLLARNQKYKVQKLYSKNGNIYVDVDLE